MDAIRLLPIIAVLFPFPLALADSNRFHEVQRRLIEVEAREQSIANLGSDLKVRYGDHGTVAQITGVMHLPTVSEAGNAGIADQILAALRLPLNLGPSSRLSLDYVRPEGNDGYTIRLSQSIHDIPVVGAHVAIAYNDSSIANIVTAHVVTERDLPHIPVVTAVDAAGLAASALPLEHVTEVTGTRLVYLHSRNLGPALAWESYVKGALADGSLDTARVFIDAIAGQVLGIWPTVAHGKWREVFSAENSATPDQIRKIEEGESTSDQKALNVYNHTGTAFDFFQSAFGRSIYIGAEGPSTNDELIRSTVRYCPSEVACPYNNAKFDSGGIGFPDDAFLFFGDGDSSGSPVYGDWGDSLDMVVHEYMHGITHKDADLLLTGQAGGINEALSDIFAAAVDAYENGLSTATWRIAEDVYEPSNANSAIRVMSDPKAGSTGNPMDDYQHASFLSASTHDKAGVANLAFYLLSQGGTHPRGVTSNNVSGVGLTKARRVVYEAVPLLDFNASFAQLRSRVAGRAEALYGTAEKASVHQAFDAVRVPGSPNFPPDMPASISASSWYCYGWYTISWPETLGATDYDLRHKVNSGGDYMLGTILYIGTSTSVAVNVPSTGYVGVRACNASGCSGFRGDAYVQRQSMCQ